MSQRQLRRIASALFGLALTLGLTMGQIKFPPPHSGSLPTISTLSDEPGSDPGGGG
jgi:hypothetical protein